MADEFVDHQRFFNRTYRRLRFSMFEKVVLGLTVLALLVGVVDAMQARSSNLKNNNAISEVKLGGQLQKALVSRFK